MSSINGRNIAEKNPEGGVAVPLSPLKQLERLIMSCLLWEDNFYIDGKTVADLIKELCHKITPEELIHLTIKAKKEQKLRHAPLMLAAELSKHSKAKGSRDISNVIYEIVTRPDDLTEFLALLWYDGKRSLSNQVKKGLARAFTKFDAYQLAKYNRDKAIKLRDVMFMVHPKPLNDEQAETFKKLANKQLESPDTWEVRLSGGEDKKKVFEELLQARKLGELAFIRNLRNMIEAKVDLNLIKKRFEEIGNNTLLLPFQFISAAKMAPSLEPLIEEAMLRVLTNPDFGRLPGITYLLVDVSGSMDMPLSDKSILTRLDAACALAILIRELIADSLNIKIMTFSGSLVEIPNRKGMALRDAIVASQPHSCTMLGASLDVIHGRMPAYDRLIVITDEQSQDNPRSEPTGKNRYIMNVGPGVKALQYIGKYLHINGFSESVVQFIQQLEKEKSE